MGGSDHDLESTRVDEDALTPEKRRKAGIVVCKAPLRQPDPRTDAELLLNMLGLAPKAGAAGTPEGACPVCEKPLPLHALAPKCGLRGTCSPRCKRELYPNQGVK